MHLNQYFKEVNGKIVIRSYTLTLTLEKSYMKYCELEERHILK